jgi:hypothetical protein
MGDRHSRNSHYRFTRSDPAFPARWFTAFCALSPVSMTLLVTVAREHVVLADLAPAQGCTRARFPKFAPHRSAHFIPNFGKQGARANIFDSSAVVDLKFLKRTRGNRCGNFKSAALVPHAFAVRVYVARLATQPTSIAFHSAFVAIASRPSLGWNVRIIAMIWVRVNKSSEKRNMSAAGNSDRIDGSHEIGFWAYPISGAGKGPCSPDERSDIRVFVPACSLRSRGLRTRRQRDRFWRTRSLGHNYGL